jgi:hypothetical protein
LRRARPRTDLRRHAHLGRPPEERGYRRGDLAAVVPEMPPLLRVQVLRDVSDGDGRPRPRRLRRPQHHRLRPSRQRSGVQLGVGTVDDRRQIRRGAGRRRQAVQRGVRHGHAPSRVRQPHAEQGPADHGDRAQGQVDKQPRPEGEDREGVRDAELPGDSAALVRVGSGEAHHEQEAESDLERGRRHSVLVRGHVEELRQFHKVSSARGQERRLKFFMLAVRRRRSILISGPSIRCSFWGVR